MKTPPDRLASGSRILVVDDNRAIHEDFKKILGSVSENSDFADIEASFFGDEKSASVEPEPFVLDFAFQGEEALQKVISAREEGHPYSVVFMDVRMPPGWNGIETTLRIWEADADLQVVICTAFSDFSWSDMVARLGHTDRFLIIKKPFDSVEVIQCAHSLSGKWALLQQIRNQNIELENEVRDRTSELLGAMNELESARDTALESLRLKGRFLANMSHEIRTPMNGIIGMGELLSKTPLTREQSDHLQIIRSSSSHLLGIINDILDSSKIESKAISFSNHNFDLLELIESSLDIVSHSARSKKLELVGYLETGVPRYLCGDSGRLRQVITNVLGNAVKFTQIGEVVFRVSLESETQENASLKFEIRDTGIGIPPKIIDSIFDPFSQADESNTRQFGGTGLGLSISRQIVEALGGTLNVTSQEGEGSTFSFNLNLKKQEQIPAAEIENVAKTENHVLIFWENESARDGLMTQVANLGLGVKNTDDVETALTMLESNRQDNDPFHYVLIREGVRGFELASRIYTNPLLKDIEQILIVSMDRVPGEERLNELHFDSYIAKPVAQTRLHSLLLGEEHPLVSISAPTEEVEPLSILIAEDNLVNRKIAMLQLQNLGFSADEVDNGRQALAAFSSKDYDLILMDCQMPEMDGYTATRKIRETSSTVRIIAMTASAMEEDRQKCMEAGMDGFLSKPFSASELERILRESPGPKTPPLPEVESSPPVDLERFNLITNGDPAMIEMISRDFISQAEEILNDISTAVQSSSIEDIGRFAHKLRGSSSTCGMNHLADTLSQLENLGQGGDIRDIEAILPNAFSQLDEIRTFLNDFVKTVGERSIVKSRPQY